MELKGDVLVYIASDKDGNRISIYDAVSGKDYFCPICNSKVIIKEGKINAKHFAHQAKQCEDNWIYDMSEWHCQMQELFPIENREIVISNGVNVHRADILINDIVIEFQHSPISAEEYKNRNDFFMSLGYRVAWVFDVNEQFEKETLSFSSDNNPYLLTWKNPIRVFSNGPQPDDKNTRFAIWLSWDIGEKTREWNKVTWCKSDENGNPCFGKIVVSEYNMELDGKLDVNELFYSKEDYLKLAIHELKSLYKYSIKYIGERGRDKEAYICPRRNEFGLQRKSEKACKYCKYCYMIANKKRTNEYKSAIYCCYPEQVRETGKAHPGYECFGAPEYDI